MVTFVTYLITFGNLKPSFSAESHCVAKGNHGKAVEGCFLPNILLITFGESCIYSTMKMVKK